MLGPLTLIFGIARQFLGPILAVFMSFVNTPIGAGITAAVGAHYVTTWSEQRKAKIVCDQRAAESQRQAFDMDTQVQVEALKRQYAAEQEVKRLQEEQATKDKTYEKALADAEREEAAAKAK